MKRCRVARPSPGTAAPLPKAPAPGVLAPGMLASGLLLAGLGTAMPALAAPGELYQVRHPVYGCANPRVMLALSGDAGPLHPEGWADLERAYGRCTMLTPSTQLELVARQGRLLLLRRLPKHGRDLLLFVPAGEVSPIRMPVAPDAVPAAPGQTATPPTASSQPAPPLVVPPATQALPETAAPPTDAAPAQAPAPEQPASAPPVVPVLPAPPSVAPPPAIQNGPQAVVPSGTPARTEAPPATSTPPVAVPPPSPPGFDTASPDSAAPAPDSTAVPVPTAGAGPDRAGTAATPATPPPAAAAGGSTSAPASPVAPPSASPVVPAPQPAPSARILAPWPPTARAVHRTGYPLLIGLLVLLLMAASIATAWMVARRRRHFTRVEEDWPSLDRQPSAPAVEVPPPLPSPHAFRTLCAAALEQAGWSTRIAFPGDGTGPDIVGRRDKKLLVVRCRTSRSVIGSEMINEAATMGGKQPGSLVVLASNAAFSQAARDEAARQRVHLLRDTDLYGFVG